MQAIGCLILFTFANVLSTLLAKMMASHFHKATYFHKMQEAIRKVPFSPSALRVYGMSHAHSGRKVQLRSGYVWPDGYTSKVLGSSTCAQCSWALTL